MKGEPGLDHFEGRSWRGWHHHVMLVFVAWAFLQLQRRGRKRGLPAGRCRKPVPPSSKSCFAGPVFASPVGERWAEDLGHDNYNLPGYWSGGRGGSRWTYYRLRAQGHNTLVIRPGDHDDQVPTAAGKVLAFESKPDRAVAVIDMTPAYADWATRAQRTFELDLRAEAAVTVRDELELEQSEDVYWFMHTKANIAIDADGQRARLEPNRRTLYAHLLQPADARFSVLDAAPLPGTPDPERQAQNKGVRRLTVKLEQVSASQIEIVFSASPDLPTAANLTSRP